MNRTKSILLTGAAGLCLLAGRPVPAGAAGVAAIQTGPSQPAPGNQNAPAAAPAAAAGDTSSTDNNGASFNGTTVTIPHLPNSDENYLDDKLRWDTPVQAHAVGANGGVDMTNGYCLPAHKRVVGMSSTFTSAATTSAAPNGGGTTAPAKSYLPVTLDTKGGIFFSPEQPVPKADQTTAQTNTHMCKDVSNFQDIADGTEFYIDADDLKKTATRSGWDFGTLVVPFKLQLSGKNAFTSSATVGAYLGYRMPFDDIGFGLSPVIFAGASNISTSQTTGGTTQSQTVAGISYGFGLIANIKDSFNMGLVFGADHVDSAQPYAYSDKPWVSFEIGYSFAQ